MANPAMRAARQFPWKFFLGVVLVVVFFAGALAVAAFAVTSSTASFMLMPLVLALFVGSPVAGRTEAAGLRRR